MLYATRPNDTFLKPSDTLRDALVSMDRSGLRVCLILDEEERLLGILTDGDVRRALLADDTVDIRVDEVMNKSFFSLMEGTDPHVIQRAMRVRTIIQVPILNASGQVVALASRFMNGHSLAKDVTVVLMAGGLGSRLRPLTDTIPKPMLPLADRPILEHIILSLKEQGFSQFFITINYLGDQIVSHFGDGSEFGVSIEYVRETKRLGTAGALSLLPPDRLAETILVLNGDVITTMPFGDLVLSHLESDAQASMCVREQSVRVEFGVVEFDDDSNTFMSLKEKPIVKHFINAGIYCLSKNVLDLIPKNEAYDMPNVFEFLNDGSGNARVYPCDGFWVDIGRPSDYETVQALFEKTAQMRRDRELSVEIGPPAPAIGAITREGVRTE